MANENFPDFFYRGLSNKNFINNNKCPTIEAFSFDKNIREDGYREMSINWETSKEALDVLFKQKKSDGRIQFSAGAVKMNFSLLKSVTSQFVVLGKFNYEKREVSGNPYHGNLLFKPDQKDTTLAKQDESMIRNTLAMIASTIPVIENPEVEN